MTDYLFKLLGIQATGVGRLTRTALEFHGINPGYLLLTALVLGLLVFWMYRRSAHEVSPWRKYTMAILRCLLLLLILVLLLRPVLMLSYEHVARRSVLVVLDASSSMSQIKDLRSDLDDRKRTALAAGLLDPAKGLNQPMATTATTQPSRLQVVRSALRNPKLNLLRRLAHNCDLSVFTFNSGPRPEEALSELSAAAYQSPGDAVVAEDDLRLDLSWVDKLQAIGPKTAIGDSIRQVISRKRGQPLAGIILVTDGANNSGSQPLDAARMAGQDGIPLYVWGVGITSPKDIIVQDIFAQEVAFAKDEVPITVRVRSMGMAGQSATLTVTMGPEKAQKQVTFNADGEQLVTVTLTPKMPGEMRIDASIPAREDEVSSDNNTAKPQPIRVIDSKIKVLLVEQAPRWEFKYLQAILMRDRRIDLKCILLEGDPSITNGPDSPYLPQFPRTREELFKYDLVILGDVDAKRFSNAELDILGEFVSKFGGALTLLAGKRHNPTSYRKTIIEKMLPVELESADGAGAPQANQPIRPELTPAGKSALMLRLAATDVENVQRWSQLPPIYWTAKVARAKPAAQVLLVDPDPAKASRFGKMPILALQQYGMGQVLFVGTDNLWRWRKNTGDRYHALLWGQMAQRMALPHLLGASKRTQITTDQDDYTTGGKVTIYARLYTETFEPMTQPLIPGALTDAANQLPPAAVQLRAVPDQPGMYRGEITVRQAGAYQFGVDHDKTVHRNITVTEPHQELAETAMNKTLLEQMAAASKGEFFREENLNDLPERITVKAQKQQSTVSVELWSSPFYFLLMLLMLTAEWILRKMSQLK